MAEKNEIAEPSQAPPRAAKGPVKESRLVRVRVMKAIAFGGIRVAPKIDTNGKATPVEAIIPREVADGQKSDRVEILGPAPDGAKLGVISKK